MQKIICQQTWKCEENSGIRKQMTLACRLSSPTSVAQHLGYTQLPAHDSESIGPSAPHSSGPQHPLHNLDSKLLFDVKKLFNSLQFTGSFQLFRRKC